MALNKKTKRKFIDWDSIEPLFRAGTLSNREIAAQYAEDHKHSQTWRPTVAESAIRKKSKSENWQRNIATKVQERVRERLVRTAHSSAHQQGQMTEDELIEAAAEKPVAVRLLQRSRAQELAERGDRLQVEFDTVLNAGVTAKNIYNLVCVYSKLVSARAKLQEMESEAFGLNDKDETAKRRIKITRVKEGN